MRHSLVPVALVSALASAFAQAAEVTVKNDSLTDFGTAVVVSGFTANEKAAAWLTSPCNGNVRAAQIFWRSLSGATAPQFGQAIEISRSATFPVPGAVVQSIPGPVLNDGVINEYRFVDQNNTVPVSVPVVSGETFVVALDFDSAPPAQGPSVVRDVDGCQAGRNTILAELSPGGPVAWFSSCSLGVQGDWVIRAVVDCVAAGGSTDLALSKLADVATYVPGTTVGYTLVASNAGPTAVSGARVLDSFPASLVAPAWTCTPGAGSSCGAPAGNGNIDLLVNLPVGGSVTLLAQALVAPATTGALVNSASVVPPAGVTESNPANNLATATIAPGVLFSDGFE